MERTEFLIIGGGPGGYEIAAELANKGHDVILVERDKLGGTCLNRGCIPTKCLCASSATALTVADAARFGVEVGSFSLDYTKAAARIIDVVAQLRSGVESMLAKVNVIYGEASLTADKTVRVNDKEYSADHIIIATGSTPASLPIPGASFAVNSDKLLSLTDVPQRVAIIGGGVIGIEFASILSAFGCEVTVIEYCKEILPPFDAEIAKRLRMALTRRGIKFITSAAVKAIEPGLRVIFESRKGKDSVECDMAVMAVGRKPVIPAGCNLAGIELNERGFIKVDELMQTTASGIYAVGDVNGLCMLAHAASAQARRAVGSDVNLDIIPSAVFSIPEAAMVGLTEEQAIARDNDIMIGKASYAANGKALAMGEESGTVKMIFNRQSGFILGCHVVGAHASDLVAEVAALMFGMTTREELDDELVHSHPTLSEVLPAAARAAR